MLNNIHPVMAASLAPFVVPRMDKWRVHYTYHGEAGEIDVYAFTDDHAWDKGRTNAARRHMCDRRQIKILEIVAI